MPKIKTQIFDADNTFFTSDLHLGQTFIQKLRGYIDKDEMHEDLIAKWNDIIPLDANVFILGDITFTSTPITMSILGQLNGKLHLIRGNHDKSLSNIILDLFISISDIKEIYIRDLETGRKTRVYMSHCSHQVWSSSHYGAYHLFGHSHGTIKAIGRSMDVGLDTHNIKPYTWEEIDTILYPTPIHKIDQHEIRKIK